MRFREYTADLEPLLDYYREHEVQAQAFDVFDVQIQGGVHVMKDVFATAFGAPHDA